MKIEINSDTPVQYYYKGQLKNSCQKLKLNSNFSFQSISYNEIRMSFHAFIDHKAIKLKNIT